MKEEEEKREEAEVDKLEETEYEDTLEDSNELINPSSANDVEVNYENGNAAAESGRQAETEDGSSGNDIDGSEETPEKKTHLPADAPWLSRMMEGKAPDSLRPTEQCVRVVRPYSPHLSALTNVDSFSVYDVLASWSRCIWRTRSPRGHFQGPTR
jgi:hypothetical protein